MRVTAKYSTPTWQVTRISTVVLVACTPEVEAGRVYISMLYNGLMYNNLYKVSVENFILAIHKRRTAAMWASL